MADPVTPSTNPGLADKGSQYGDIDSTNQGLAALPLAEPRGSAVPSAPTRRPNPTPGRSGAALAAPDPVDFAITHLNRTRLGTTPAPSGPKTAPKMLPLLWELAKQPGSSGLLRAAVVAQLHRYQAESPRTTVVDMNDLDAAVQRWLTPKSR